ncbi:MAG: TauD/TfdA family dioxygenase [Acidobacteriota bacterium]|nr:TauD/TfdA family dioxygenase [Acidobacteriota bacterium]
MTKTHLEDLDLTADGTVSSGFHPTGPDYPLIVKPLDPDTDPIEWAEDHQDFIQAAVSRYGGVMFRDFPFEDVEDFDEFVKTVSGGPLPYMEQSSPRDAVYGNIYTSTSHPAGEEIYLHNEQSYNLNFPLRIYFYCVTPAAERGATPIADTRRIAQQLPGELVRRFAERQYQYVRNFGEGFGVTWQTAFQTEDKSKVEAYCRANGIDIFWKEGDRLKTVQTRPAVATHPRTGETAWFNHIIFFHVTTLNPEVCNFLRAEFAEGDLPNNTFYGDGSDIEEDVLATLRAAYEREKVAIPWQRGDLLMLDNMLMSHGRESFQGSRKVVVAMSDPIAWQDVRYRIS